MNRIFFKTIWNNRKRNLLIFIELFAVSLVLFNVTLYLTDVIRIKMIKPCFDNRNVVLSYAFPYRITDSLEMVQSIKNMKIKVASNPMVECAAYAINATPNLQESREVEVAFGNESLTIEDRRVEIDYQKAMKVELLKGRWFDESDFGKMTLPVVISADLEKKYFKGDALGKQFGSETVYHVIGVVNPFKSNDQVQPRPMMLRLMMLNGSDVSMIPRIGIQMLIRVKEGMVERYLQGFEQEFNTVYDKSKWFLADYNSLENMKSDDNKTSAQRRYVGLLVAIFFVINVFLGMIGVLWFNTNLRTGEFGIKRALGATRLAIGFGLIKETLMIGCLVAFFISIVFIQIPALRIIKVDTGVIWISIAESLVVMFLLILLSSWIPARIASRIQPATALKSE